MENFLPRFSSTTMPPAYRVDEEGVILRSRLLSAGPKDLK